MIKWSYWCWNNWLLNSPPPNSRALLPTYSTNCPYPSHFAQIGCHFAQITTPNPCSLLSHHTPLVGICVYTKHPQPHHKTPLFLAWTWKCLKRTTIWVTWTQTGKNKVDIGQNFSRSEQKKIFIRNGWHCLTGPDTAITSRNSLVGVIMYDLMLPSCRQAGTTAKANNSIRDALDWVKIRKGVLFTFDMFWQFCNIFLNNSILLHCCP